MPDSNRRFRGVSETVAEKAFAEQRREMDTALDTPVTSGPFRISVSADPVVAQVRAILEANRRAKPYEAAQPGHPIEYDGLLHLLDFVEQGGWRIGRIGNRRFGTARKGRLVQAAAEALGLKPNGVYELARKLADLAGACPECVINPPLPLIEPAIFSDTIALDHTTGVRLDALRCIRAFLLRLPRQLGPFASNGSAIHEMAGDKPKQIACYRCGVVQIERAYAGLPLGKQIVRLACMTDDDLRALERRDGQAN